MRRQRLAYPAQRGLLQFGVAPVKSTHADGEGEVERFLVGFEGEVFHRDGAE